MILFTSQEIIDLIVMILVIGYIFSKIFPKKNIVISKDYDPLKQYTQKNNFLEDLKWGIIVAAPAIVFHELAHKFVAMSFGAIATLHAPYMMYAVVVALIFLKSPIIFFVGGYVTHTPLPALQSALVSIAGPLTNLLIWFICDNLLKSKSSFAKKNLEIIAMMKKINMFLFIFNMIPIPGFDGFNFLSAMFKYATGFF